MLITDVETTGLSAKKCSIVSIGAIDFSNPERTFYRECKPWEGALLEEGALKCNGFTREQLMDGNRMPLVQAMTDYVMWVLQSQEQTLAGHNFGTFDSKFIKAAVEMYNLNWRIQSRCVDLHSVCYADYLKRGIPLPQRNNRTNITSDVAFQYVGLPAEPQPHNALTGAKCIAEAFSRIIYGKSLLKEFEQHPIPEHFRK